MQKLAKPKNFRIVIPEVCFFCRQYEANPSGWYCEREGEDWKPKSKGHDLSAPFRHTCDRFASKMPQ